METTNVNLSDIRNVIAADKMLRSILKTYADLPMDTQAEMIWLYLDAKADKS